MGPTALFYMALGTVLQSLFSFVKDLDGMPYVNQAEYRHAFSGWFPMNADIPSAGRPG